MDDDRHETDFTRLLELAQSGDTDGEQRFCELVNDELRRAAGCLVRGDFRKAQPTSLVNEVFVRLFRLGVTDDLKNRRYFFAVAIDQMRQILRERIRHRETQTQGGHLQRQPLDVVLDQYLDDFGKTSDLDFLVLDEALQRLKTGSATARQYEALRLHYFVGMEQQEIAEVLRVDPSVVSKDLKAARAKLSLELMGEV